LTTSQKKIIRDSSPVQLFEIFFSAEMKNHIIEATNLNNGELSLSDLNIFIGILILSAIKEKHNEIIDPPIYAVKL